MDKRQATGSGLKNLISENITQMEGLSGPIPKWHMVFNLENKSPIGLFQNCEVSKQIFRQHTINTTVIIKIFNRIRTRRRYVECRHVNQLHKSLVSFDGPIKPLMDLYLYESPC